MDVKIWSIYQNNDASSVSIEVFREMSQNRLWSTLVKNNWIKRGTYLMHVYFGRSIALFER